MYGCLYVMGIWKPLLKLYCTALGASCHVLYLKIEHFHIARISFQLQWLLFSGGDMVQHSIQLFLNCILNILQYLKKIQCLCYGSWFRLMHVCFPQGSVEPMQIDADPQEDQQNASESNYIVENPTLVLTGQILMNAKLIIYCAWRQTHPKDELKES